MGRLLSRCLCLAIITVGSCHTHANYPSLLLWQSSLNPYPRLNFLCLDAESVRTGANCVAISASLEGLNVACMDTGISTVPWLFAAVQRCLWRTESCSPLGAYYVLDLEYLYSHRVCPLRCILLTNSSLVLFPLRPGCRLRTSGTRFMRTTPCCAQLQTSLQSTLSISFLLVAGRRKLSSTTHPCSSNGHSFR